MKLGEEKLKLKKKMQVNGVRVKVTSYIWKLLNLYYKAISCIAIEVSNNWRAGTDLRRMDKQDRNR